jgi:uncharacterized membrane protein
MTANKPPTSLHIQRYLLTGLLTVIPLWLTWIVFEFVLRQLSKLSAPLVGAMARVPGFAALLETEWVRFFLAVALTILFLYALGWAANRVVGLRMLAMLDGIMARIPLVQSIYGGTKKLLAVLQTKPEGAQRVVLVEFPNKDMRAVGFVTRILREDGTGRELAAVYVPTTPNPTSGYLEIVPVERLTQTDWTVDQAMAFIISGGAMAPESVPEHRRGDVLPPQAPPAPQL